MLPSPSIHFPLLQTECSARIYKPFSSSSVIFVAYIKQISGFFFLEKISSAPDLNLPPLPLKPVRFFMGGSASSWIILKGGRMKSEALYCGVHDWLLLGNGCEAFPKKEHNQGNALPTIFCCLYISGEDGRAKIMKSYRKELVVQCSCPEKDLFNITGQVATVSQGKRCVRGPYPR